MQNIDNLKPEEYQAVIGPALHAAADIAAARGDPDLYNDLASMLALMTLVHDLSDLYQYQWGALGQMSEPKVFEQAPLAASVIVLQEQKLEEHAITAMTQALEKAYNMLRADNVLGTERVDVQKAWDAMMEEKTDLAHEHMKQATRRTVQLIEKWELGRVQASH